MTISTRLAEPDDAIAIADLHVASWRVAYRGIIPNDVLDDPALAASRRAGWHRALVDGHRHVDDPAMQTFVGVSTGQVVGFAQAGIEAEPVTDDGGQRRFPAGGEIHGFYLHPDAWGSGIADLLMSDCLRHLDGRFDHGVLWVLRDNPRARRFYERHGWECGTGPDLIEIGWSGPAMPGAPALPEPVAEVQYRRYAP